MENNIHAHTYASVACQLFAAVLVCSCNAAAPHFQPKNKLSRPQPASQQPSMQQNNIYIHVYALASLQLLSSRLHAAVLLQLLAKQPKYRLFHPETAAKIPFSTKSPYSAHIGVCYVSSLPMQSLHLSHLACLPGACYLQVSEYMQRSSIRNQRP